MSGNPINLVDPFGLEGIGSWTYAPGTQRDAYQGASNGRRADYIHASLGLYVATVGITVTRNGTVFVGYGTMHGTPKSLVSGKLGGSIAAGNMKGCPTGTEVDNYVQGATTGAAAYYGLGGGFGKNAAGSAVEMGFGIGGGAMQAYEYMVPVGSIGEGWR